MDKRIEQELCSNEDDFNSFEMDDNAEELVFSCSICDKDLNPFMEHFKGHVCKECMLAATDDDGRPIKFCADNKGGIVARYADDDEVYESEICYVHGIKCRVETEEMRNGYDVVGRIEKDARENKFIFAPKLLSEFVQGNSWVQIPNHLPD